MAKPGEALDMTEPPSEAFDRREVVMLTGETAQHCKQMLLPIIRTDAGGFFGFGEQYRTNLAGTNWTHLLSPTNLPSR